MSDSIKVEQNKVAIFKAHTNGHCLYIQLRWPSGMERLSLEL